MSLTIRNVRTGCGCARSWKRFPASQLSCGARASSGSGGTTTATARGTGHEGDAAAIGFSPRAANLTIYVVGGYDGQDDVLARLGKHKIGKSCLYIKRLSDVDETALRELIQVSLDNAARFHVDG